MNTIASIRSILFVGAIALLPELASAGAPITFSSNRGAGIVNLQSDGTTSIDSSFTFEIGAFSKLPDGSAFVPTASNASEWEERWSTLASTGYNEAPNNFFTGSTSLESNAQPFSMADTPYIWGFNSHEGVAEWILIRRDGNNAWTWPNAGAGGINPGRTFFTVSDTLDGLSTIVGEFAGNGFLMKTQSITLPGSGVSYSQWVAANFSPADLADPTISGETADPDSDGFSNLFEFATGNLPQSAGSTPEITHTISPGGQVQLAIAENPEALVIWELEVSTDLDVWDSLDPIEAGTSDGAIRTFTDPVAFGAIPRRFLRISVREQ